MILKDTDIQDLEGRTQDADAMALKFPNFKQSKCHGSKYWCHRVQLYPAGATENIISQLASCSSTVVQIGPNLWFPPADYHRPSAYTNLPKPMGLNAASTHYMQTFKARTSKTTWHCYAFVGHESRGIKPQRFPVGLVSNAHIQVGISSPMASIDQCFRQHTGMRGAHTPLL